MWNMLAGNGQSTSLMRKRWFYAGDSSNYKEEN